MLLHKILLKNSKDYKIVMSNKYDENLKIFEFKKSFIDILHEKENNFEILVDSLSSWNFKSSTIDNLQKYIKKLCDIIDIEIDIDRMIFEIKLMDYDTVKKQDLTLFVHKLLKKYFYFNVCITSETKTGFFGIKSQKYITNINYGSFNLN